MKAITVRPIMTTDWTVVEAIFAEGIATGQATFESAPPSWEAFDAGRLSHSRLVAEDEAGEVVGWVAASPVSARKVYEGVVEHSVYVASSARGRGVGALLLGAFIESAEARGVWTIQSSIFPENIASARLHEAFGFRVVGRRERIALMTYGPMAGVWRDTVILERRSSVN